MTCLLNLYVVSTKLRKKLGASAVKIPTLVAQKLAIRHPLDDPSCSSWSVYFKT